MSKERFLNALNTIKNLDPDTKDAILKTGAKTGLATAALATGILIPPIAPLMLPVAQGAAIGAAFEAGGFGTKRAVRSLEKRIPQRLILKKAA